MEPPQPPKDVEVKGHKEATETSEKTHEEKSKSIKMTQEYHILLDMPTYFSFKLYKKYSYGHYNSFSIIDHSDPDRKRFTDMFRIMFENKTWNPELLGLESEEESRCIASIMGLGICDALGASTEFIPFEKNRKGLIENGFADVKQRIKDRILDSRAGKIGIWTDDCSMALCLADSILLKQYKFDPIHVRYMFTMWLEHGLNNGGRPHSIGLGGNIAISMTEFMKEQTQFAIKGDRFNNGNGSLMRLAPVPIAYHKNEEEAMKYSELSSRTTHNGDEAKECCRLLALILCRLVNRPKGADWRETLTKACADFTTKLDAVRYLADSKKETEEMYKRAEDEYGRKFTKYNKSVDDRDWNWKDKAYTYSHTRTKQQPGYIGSYCMDALSMALHTVWFTNDFKSAAIWSANMGGDCDTVGAIAGQIAGAAYGIDEKMLQLYSEMVDCQSFRFDVFLKAYKLARGKKLSDE